MQDLTLENQCKNAVKINEDNLFQLLYDNKNTSFGQMHGFSKINTIEEFRQNVPLTKYSYYRSYIESMRSGVENVLTSYPLAGYCKTSGTEGNIKFIPVTYESLERYSDQSERYPMYVLNQTGGGKRLYINIFRTDPGHRDGKALLFSELYNTWLYETGKLDISTQAGGQCFLFEKTKQNSLYAKVCIAFLTEDLVTIEAPFMYDILHFFSYMEKNWKKILTNLREHNIPHQIELSKTIRDTILSFPVNENRFNEIESECQKGFKNIAKRLWKKMSLISGISSRSYSAEDNALKYYTGNIPHQHLCYCSSECYIGTPISENNFSYVLLPNNGFFEFLPYGREDEGPLLPHELKIGEQYEIIVTNFSGFYRYRLGDIIKIIDFCYESPVFEFAFRRDQAINIGGEKMTVCQLEEAVQRMRSNVNISTYCFGASTLNIPGFYFAVAVTDGDDDEKKYSELLDYALSRVNEDYRDLRELSKLSPPRFFCVSNDHFDSIMNNHFSQHRHNKPVHVFKLASTESILKEITSNET